MRLRVLALFIVMIFVGCDQKENPTPIKKAPEEKITGKSLSIGSISVNYKYEEELYRPIIQYLVEHLKEYGYTEAKSVIVSSMEELISKANTNKVDIFFGSLYPTVTLDKNSKLEPVLKAHQIGRDYYYSVFFTLADSEINSLENLNGKTVVFENKFSTSGFFYPTVVLKKMGYNLVELENPNQKFDKNKLGYTFSSDDGNTVIWIFNGVADIGVTDSDVFEYYSSSHGNKIKMLHKSKKLTRFITSIRGNLEPKVKDTIVKTFLEMPNDEKGGALLEKLLQITNFEKIDSLSYIETKQDFESFLLD